MKKYFTADNLARLAIVFNVFAYIVYNSQVLLGRVHPNQVVWFIWSFITILNFTSIKISTGDGMKSWLPTAGSALCIMTFLIAIFNGKFEVPSWDNQVVFVLGVVTSIAWKLTSSARVAQVILQGTMLFSFIPLFVQVAKTLHWKICGRGFSGR